VGLGTLAQLPLLLLSLLYPCSCPALESQEFELSCQGQYRGWGGVQILFCRSRVWEGWCWLTCGLGWEFGGCAAPITCHLRYT
jgi:hypothetical protein